MAWPPKFNAEFIAPVAANLLAYAETNAGQALEWANGAPLADFKKVYNSNVGRVSTNFPLLMLDSAATTTDQSADGARIAEVHTLSFEIAITGSSPDDLTEKIYVYVRALDALWRSMTAAEITHGMKSAHMAARVTKIDHSYDPLRGGGSAFLRVATMDVRVEIFER